MRPKVKKILVVVLVVFFLLVLVAAIVLYPYYRMPPESKAVLDARQAEFQAVAEEIAARPKDDRLALEKLFDDLAATKLTLPKEVFHDACPLFVNDEIQAQAPVLEQFQPYLDRFHAVLKDGLVMQLDNDPDADLLNFSFLRQLIFADLVAAALDLSQGRPEKAEPRLVQTIETERGLLEAKFILPVMIAEAIAQRINGTIVFLLPRLPAATIQELQKQLESLPDARVMFVESLKVEAAHSMTALDRLFTGGRDSWDRLGDNEFPVPYFLFRLGGIVGFLDRERYMSIHIRAKDIDNFQTWINSGSKEPPREVIRDDIMHSLTAQISYPNTQSLMRHCAKNMQDRRVVLAALALELQRREKKNTATVELPFDDNQAIVLDRDYGCLKSTATPK